MFSEIPTPSYGTSNLQNVFEDDPLWEFCPADLPAEPGESDQLSVQPVDPKLNVLVIESPGYTALLSMPRATERACSYL